MLVLLWTQKMRLHKQMQTLSLAMLFFMAIFSFLKAEDRFNVSVGTTNHLIISGAKGDPVAEISSPALAHAVKLGDRSFQVSFGLDATGQFAAVFSPDASTGAPLHFTVLGKNVDADKAIVTLTFSKNLKSVLVDPGYVGIVNVDSQRLAPHLLADDTVEPVSVSQITNTPLDPTPIVAAPAPQSVSDSVTTVPAVTAPVASAPDSTSVTNPSAAPNAPATLASQLAPSILDQNKPATTAVAANAATPSGTTAGVQKVKLFWAEPVTAPDGTAPQVGLNEIKLVEVHGLVSITLPSGDTKNGMEGMIIPSGSTVKTMANSSAALFMGGINSARLMPKCELTVTQSLDGAVRKTLIALERGPVFSRVGQRDGETQDFKIQTPEGTTSAETAEMLSFRGTLADVQNGTATAMNSGLILDRKQLLAWNPTSLNGNHISDIVDPMFTVSPNPLSTYYFYLKSGANISLANIEYLYFPGTSVTPSNATKILENVLVALQPFNYKLQAVVFRINSGIATKYDLVYFQNLSSIYLNTQLPNLLSAVGLSGQPLPKNLQNLFMGASLLINQVLAPFITPSLTPF